MRKATEVMEILMRSGFDMSLREFYETTVDKILRKYQIETKLNLEEYKQLLRLMLDRCAENDIKNMGIFFVDTDDLKYK